MAAEAADYQRNVNWFSYHAPTVEQRLAYEKLRFNGGNMADMITELCPASPERSTALRKLREAVMWANASIACNPKE